MIPEDYDNLKTSCGVIICKRKSSGEKPVYELAEVKFTHCQMQINMTRIR